jgi:5-methylcytosine-specific restriction endonuclease McrA
MVHEGYSLRSARATALARDGGQCVLCGARDEPTAHHILPRAIGGPNSPENLITICRACHEALNREAARIAAVAIWQIGQRLFSR